MEDTTHLLERINERLSDLEQADAHLTSPLAFYRKLLPVLRQGPVLSATLAFDPHDAQILIDAGQPVVANLSLSILREPAERFFRQVCEVIVEFQPSVQDALTALSHQRLPLSELLTNLACGRLETVETAAETAEVSPILLRMLVEYTLRPTLRAWAEQAQGHLSLEGWQQTRCPICGNPPLVSEIRGAKRDRYLRCGICGAAWPYPRLQCALCGNSDARTQSILCEDGEERKIYAHTCKHCKGYIKCFYTEEPLLVDLLPVEDLVTLYLDQGCQERGYSRLGVDA